MNNLAENRIFLDDEYDNQAFLSDVLNGLKSTPKKLPCKYFYDEVGSDLFEQICQLDEYYITRTELKILATHGDDIAKHIEPGVTVIEPGAGSGKKAKLLLSALDSPSTFVPLEISGDALDGSADVVRQSFPGIAVKPMLGDFTDSVDMRKLHQADEGNGHRLVFFPGSTIGNFPIQEACSILENLRLLAGDSGQVLIGVDMIKDRQRLVRAYDDVQGVTARFNKNILVRINKEFSSNFNVETGFEHQAVYNEEANRIEMHLVSTTEQSVSILGEAVSFAADETIHTESSHKYSVNSFLSLANQAGLELKDSWRDANQDFSIFLLQSGRN